MSSSLRLREMARRATEICDAICQHFIRDSSANSCESEHMDVSSETLSALGEAVTASGLDLSIRFHDDNDLSPDSITFLNAAVTSVRNDPYGDGDQTPCGATHPLYTDSDCATALITNFSEEVICSKGDTFLLHRAAFRFDIDVVTEVLHKARRAVEGGDSDAIAKILDRRISAFRDTLLHSVCYAALSFNCLYEKNSENAYAIVDALCKAGARVDARNIFGCTPLYILAIAKNTAFRLNAVRLARLLVSHGANPDVMDRRGDGLLVSSITSKNHDLFRELLRLGADVSLADRNGYIPRDLASRSPELMAIITEVQREKMLLMMKCDNCGKTGASKTCSACDKTYYCDKVCQKARWKVHKPECRKSSGNVKFLDIDVETMTSEGPVPSFSEGSYIFMNKLTEIVSNRKMIPTQYDSYFTVKVNGPYIIGGTMGSVKMYIKNSDHLFVSPAGAGQTAYRTLLRLIEERGMGLQKVYLKAKWLREAGEAGSSQARHVLRLDISTVMPPPNPIW